MIKTNKLTRCVTAEKIKYVGELITNVTFKEKNFKLKIFEMIYTNNLFDTDLLEQFQLLDMPINSFCQKKKKKKMQNLN